MNWARRAGWYAAAPLFGLLLYWRVPFTWFVNDDFAWLGLPLLLRRGDSLLHVLFTPFAQGTVRVLSERVFFLVFSEWFGLHALPYRIWILATWIAAVTLALLVGKELAGSKAAGLIAALLWAVNTNAVPAVAWASAYNQTLCAVCLLGAFYSRLRGWRAAEWIAYLAGFGALELIVAYPLIAALHMLCTDRKDHRKLLRGTGLLFVPAALFAAVQILFIPKAPGPVYALSFDRRLPGTLAAYLGWMFQPGSSALGAHAAVVRGIELGAGLIIGAALAAFSVREILRGERLALFCWGWFAILLAPVLPLANHLTSYYLTLPAIGLAWLGGWAIKSAWRAGWVWRGAAAAIAGLYVLGCAAGVNAQTRWFQSRAARMHQLVDAVAAEAAAHPGAAIAVQGVDDELYESGFRDDPFRLVGAARVAANVSIPDGSGTVRVLRVSPAGVQDITP